MTDVDLKAALTVIAAAASGLIGAAFGLGGDRQRLTAVETKTDACAAESTVKIQTLTDRAARAERDHSELRTMHIEHRARHEVEMRHILESLARIENRLDRRRFQTSEGQTSDG